MEHFTLECDKCASTDIEFDVYTAQGAGYVVMECKNCGNDETVVQDH